MQTYRALYVSENGHRWDLLKNFDDEIFVRHTGNVSSGGHIADMGLGVFLTLGRNGPEHQAMWKLIATLLINEPAPISGPQASP